MHYAYRHELRQPPEPSAIPTISQAMLMSCTLLSPLSVSCLAADRCCEWLAEAIEQARQRQDFLLWAFVFMPDHVHLIV